MLKQTVFLVHRGTDILADSIIICGHCEMPIWRMTTTLNGLVPYFGYRGIPKQFITSLDGGPPIRPRYFNKKDPYWQCPECGMYIIKDPSINTAVFFEMPPIYFACSDGSLDPSIGHRLRFFVDYEYKVKSKCSE